MNIMSLLLSEEDFERLENDSKSSNVRTVQLKLSDEFTQETFELGEKIMRKYLLKSGIKPTEENLKYLKEKTLDIFNFHLNSFSSKNNKVYFGYSKNIYVDYLYKNNACVLAYKFFSEKTFTQQNFFNEILNEIKINYTTGVKYVTIAYINNQRSRK